MISRLGRKLVAGAKAEIQENPPEIKLFDTERVIELVEAGIALIGIGLLAFSGIRGSSMKQPMTIINNVYINGIKQ